MNHSTRRMKELRESPVIQLGSGYGGASPRLTRLKKGDGGSRNEKKMALMSVCVTVCDVFFLQELSSFKICHVLG